MFTIEKGIPIPTVTRRGKAEKYNFSEMEIGDSFFVANEEGKDSQTTQKTVQHAAYSAEKRLEKKHNEKRRFTVRPWEEKNEAGEVTKTGVRVWRTANSQS